MQNFKQQWQITHNWQLIFPFLGIVGLLYSSFKLARLISGTLNVGFTILICLLIFYVLLKLCLFFFKKLEHKWIVDQKWEIIRIFIVFAITGSSSVLIGRPFIKAVGITKENLNVFIYWCLFIFISLVFYQILLVAYGWLFGQFKFFWAFEKKMLARMGFKRFL